MGDFTLRNRFARDAVPTGPVRQYGLASSPAAAAPGGSGGPVTGSGPGYAAANLARPASMGGPESAAEKAYGNAQHNAKTPEEFAANKQQFEQAQAASRATPTLQSAPQGAQTPTGMPEGANVAMAGNTPVSMSEWFMKQLGDKAGTPWKFMAKGGKITEPIMGMGMNTGARYMFGEHGDEQVTPMSGVDASSPDQADEQMAAELQKVLGRNVLIRSKRPVKTSKVAGVPESATKNSSLAVNAPVIRLTDDDIRALANRPEYKQLITRLIEAEKRGGVEITKQDGTPYGGQSTTGTGGSPTGTVAGTQSAAGPTTPTDTTTTPGGGDTTPTPDEPPTPSPAPGTTPGYTDAGGNTITSGPTDETSPGMVPGLPITPQPMATEPQNVNYGGVSTPAAYEGQTQGGQPITELAMGGGKMGGSFGYPTPLAETAPGATTPREAGAGSQVTVPQYGGYTPPPTRGGEQGFDTAPTPNAVPSNPITWAPGWGPDGAVSSAPTPYADAGGNSLDAGATDGGDMFSVQAPPDAETEEERMLRLASEAGLTA